MLDTGIAARHPHFRRADGKNTVLEQWDCTRRGAPVLHKPGQPSFETLDGNGHGTHVAAIIAGGVAGSEYLGMAPDAQLIGFKVLKDSGAGEDAFIIKALDKVAEINEKAGRLVIHGLNLSLGGAFDPMSYNCGHTPLCQELRRLWNQGVLVCVAAGNEGYAVLEGADGPIQSNMDLSIGDPANLEEGITVGSVHKLAPHTYGVSFFSSRGPTADGRMKPDLVAPGERILSAAHTAPAEATAEKDLYVEMSGTSQAVPHVSGLLAGFLSVRREFAGYPNRVKKILLDHATDLGRDRVHPGQGAAEPGEDAAEYVGVALAARTRNSASLPTSAMLRVFSTARLALMALAFACSALLPVSAQTVLPGTPKSEPVAAPAAPSYSIDDVRAALAAARKSLEAIEAAGETPTDAPPGTPLSEILQRLTLARTLASTYEKQLNSLEKAETARRRQAEQQRAIEGWRGFEEPPPYSVLVVDELRNDLVAARNALGNAKSTTAMFNRLETDYSAKLKAAQGAARLAAEAADRARGTPDFQKREWELGIATLRASVHAAVQGLLQIGLRGAQAEVDAANVTAELATRKLNAVGTSVELPRADLERMLVEIESRRRNAERDLNGAVKASAVAADGASRAELRTRVRARCRSGSDRRDA